MVRDYALSFELFPPKSTEGLTRLETQITALRQANPQCFSVTYGAGGSTQMRTFATVDRLRELGIETAPHLSGIGAQKEDIHAILKRYYAQGIRRLVVLRGDAPSGMGLSEAEPFRYASDLVAFIRAETGATFYIEVAAYPEVHPQARSAELDLQNFQLKIAAGANAAITQYFYNADAYFDFVARCIQHGITIPIIPGIMPMTQYAQLVRFSEACGAEIPRWMRKRLEDCADDPECIRTFGHQVVTNLCRRLLAGGAPGLHFYTMNQAAPSLRIVDELRADFCPAPIVPPSPVCHN